MMNLEIVTEGLLGRKHNSMKNRGDGAMGVCASHEITEVCASRDVTEICAVREITEGYESREMTETCAVRDITDVRHVR